MSELSDLGRRYLSPAERAEYEALLASVVAATNVTADRLDLFDRMLDDAIQAQRAWAVHIRRACVRDGAAAEIKRYQDRDRALVSHNGRLLNLPRVQGVRRRDPQGADFDARELIEVWTWDEIDRKRSDDLRMIRCYTDRIALYDRLMALRDVAPDSTSPREAADVIGTTVEQWLAGAVTA